MRFLTITYTYSFYAFYSKKPFKNWYTRKQPGHFSVIPNSLNLKTKLFRNLKILKFGMPKKITSKSQAKNKTPFPQYPFFNYF